LLTVVHVFRFGRVLQGNSEFFTNLSGEDNEDDEEDDAVDGIGERFLKYYLQKFLSFLFVFG
tara:strand:- start:1155 stop:1340 length:186 start_codon:yes stop_codon:yes gene_type:complete